MQTILFFLTLTLSYFIKHVWIKLRQQNNFGHLVRLSRAMAGQNNFLNPVHLILFTAIQQAKRGIGQMVLFKYS